MARVVMNGSEIVMAQNEDLSWGGEQEHPSGEKESIISPTDFCGNLSPKM